MSAEDFMMVVEGHSYDTPRSKSMSMDEAVELARTRFSEASKLATTIGRDFRILRGTNSGFPHLITDPKIGERKSLNMKGNFSNLLMSNLPSWEGVPKRTQSIVCSTSIHKARGYGDVYHVLPENGATIAESRDSDIYLLKLIGRHSYYGVDMDLRKVVGWIGKTIQAEMGVDLWEMYERGSENWIAMKRFLSHFEDALFYIRNNPEVDKVAFASLDDEMMWFSDFINSGYTDLLAWLNDVSTPKNAGLKLQSLSEFKATPTSIEVWTDATSLLIAEHVFKDFWKRLDS